MAQLKEDEWPDEGEPTTDEMQRQIERTKGGAQAPAPPSGPKTDPAGPMPAADAEPGA
jgi:hypothetical protein